MTETLKTGTTILGIVCKNGVVIAADRRTTAGIIVGKKSKKIDQIWDNMVIAHAGQVSDAQLFTKLIKAELKLKSIQTGRDATVEETAHLISGILYQSIRQMSMVPSVVTMLLGGKDSEGDHVYHLGIDGSVMRHDDYFSEGSGSVFVLGVLESQFKPNMTLDEGVKLATRAVNASIQRDPGSGNGIDVVTITDKGVEVAFEKQLDITL